LHFLAVGFGESLHIDEKNRSFIASICYELWNRELYTMICDDPEEQLSQSNVIERLRYRWKIGCDISTEIEFIASHFFEFSVSDFGCLDLGILGAILRHEKLKICNEEMIYDLVKSRLSESNEYFSLFEFVRYEYLSTDRLHDFFDIMLTSLEFIDQSLWNSLRTRFLLPVHPTHPNDRLAIASISCSFNSSSPLDGIISRLTRECGGNVHDKNIVKVTVSSSGRSDRPARNVVDLLVDSYFDTENRPNQWICFDFMTSTIRPTHYSIRSASSSSIDNWNLKDWVIEGSIDGTSWIELDKRTNDGQLNGRNLIATFTLNQSESIRLLRLRQTGTNHYGSNHIWFSSFEVFGTLIRPKVLG
jgi:hypothetical protein